MTPCMEDILLEEMQTSFFYLGVEITVKFESCSDVYTSKLCSVSPDPWYTVQLKLVSSSFQESVWIHMLVKSHRLTRLSCVDTRASSGSSCWPMIHAITRTCDEQDTPTLLYHPHSTQYSLGLLGWGDFISSDYRQLDFTDTSWTKIS